MHRRLGSKMRKLAVVVSLLSVLALPPLILLGWPETVRPYVPAALAVFLPPPLPAARPVERTVLLDQSWSSGDSRWYHHAGQGTATLPVPLRWFTALEQPRLAVFSQPGLLRDDAYLSRIGFIPSQKGRTHGDGGTVPSTGLGWQDAENDEGLPVGFTRLSGAGQPDRLGLTCSACHVGRIDYKGVRLLVDGGTAALNLNALEHTVSLAILYTLKVPGRFDRFADRVLGADADAAARARLREGLTQVFDKILAGVKTTGAIDAARGDAGTSEGFFRLDALNRIGNRLFFEDLGSRPEDAASYHAPDAPVRFPALWTTPWFAWAEYDSSISQPLVRSVGEALGVGAEVRLEGKDPFSSSVALDNIVWIEDLMRGADPFAKAKPAFSGLVAPRWPQAVFPDDPAWALDDANVRKGRVLYAELCAGCHLGPVRDPEFDRLWPDKAFWTSSAWRRDEGGPVLRLTEVPVVAVGTDPAQANVLRTRTVAPPTRLGLDPVRDLNETWHCGLDASGAGRRQQPFALALMNSVDRVAHRWLDDHGVAGVDRLKVFGARKNCPADHPVAVYRARPLDGVWAMAPFLHNGSVPSLDLLLRPAAQRPKQFCLGARDYNPRLVGYDTAIPCAAGETLFTEADATGRAIKGNSTAGHSFENAPIGNGVVGRALSDDERAALTEYLKTL